MVFGFTERPRHLSATRDLVGVAKFGRPAARATPRPRRRCRPPRGGASGGARSESAPLRLPPPPTEARGAGPAPHASANPDGEEKHRVPRLWGRAGAQACSCGGTAAPCARWDCQLARLAERGAAAAERTQQECTRLSDRSQAERLGVGGPPHSSLAACSSTAISAR